MKKYSYRYHALKTKERALRAELEKVSVEGLGKLFRAFMGMTLFSVGMGIVARYVRKRLKRHPMVRDIGKDPLSQSPYKQGAGKYGFLWKALMTVWRSLLWPLLWVLIRKQRRKFF